MTVFANCDFPLLSDSETIEKVLAAVAAREPFSLVRINDGEAVALSFGDDLWLQDLAYLHTHWGAERVPLGAVAEVKQDLEIAIQGADIVGIRDDIVGVSLPDDLLEHPGHEVRDHIKTAFELRRAEVDKMSPGGARRLALLHRFLSRTDWPPDQQFCSVWIHWELLATGALHRILEDSPRVGLVTSRPELEHLVARRFNVQTSTTLVPDKFVETKESGRHVPDRYRTIRSELNFPEGTPVLVGAGIPGKVYCQWLKESGCVAIDIGAVLDAWVGKASRPAVLQSRFGVTAGDRVPSDIQLRPQVASQQRRRLTPRWKPEGVSD